MKFANIYLLSIALTGPNLSGSTAYRCCEYETPDRVDCTTPNATWYRARAPFSTRKPADPMPLGLSPNYETVTPLAQEVQKMPLFVTRRRLKSQKKLANPSANKTVEAATEKVENRAKETFSTTKTPETSQPSAQTIPSRLDNL